MKLYFKTRSIEEYNALKGLLHFLMNWIVFYRLIISELTIFKAINDWFYVIPDLNPGVISDLTTSIMVPMLICQSPEVLAMKPFVPYADEVCVEYCWIYVFIIENLSCKWLPLSLQGSGIIFQI